MLILLIEWSFISKVVTYTVMLLWRLLIDLIILVKLKLFDFQVIVRATMFLVKICIKVYVAVCLAYECANCPQNSWALLLSAVLLVLNILYYILWSRNLPSGSIIQCLQQRVCSNMARNANRLPTEPENLFQSIVSKTVFGMQPRWTCSWLNYTTIFRFLGIFIIFSFI